VKYFLLLFTIFVLPLGLFFHFSSYELPGIQYFFLIGLFVSQYFYFSENGFHKKIKPAVVKQLSSELKKMPSQKEINRRSLKIEFHRHICIALIAITICGLMIVYNKF
jgi:hypothetical protein